METTAKLRYLRMSPRKVRLVVDAIRGVSVEQALARLKFSDKRAVQPVAKLLNSAIANAEHNQDLKRDNLLIKEIKVDEGPVLKRWRSRAFGRAAGIQKRTSHISIVLSEIKPSKEKADKKKGAAKSQEVKIVRSLDEIKDVSQGKTKGEKEAGSDLKDGLVQQEKFHSEKPKGPQSAKRRFFSRKSG
ncbi:50S ribosomal protein L22 [Candidatus Kuenenbacteria bacterium CG10_big_fil_rev_8_21_14_0_10_39_14]|uniref:Large ribosomal subunit protein uL22 n=1 Tax=Candidatus Kuenenbacteria bacterium CG10_big_fil_rev_8_21_14_0_10_39_14 TaxID=1974619 RepID=A0A2H0U8M6_9BACT|nr:MAG: 50S ribosomal protein L22 [Candidatus Kuenenbacteria bacterium CG10_big_fil_rev_8_21_14_0_10_39_14]